MQSQKSGRLLGQATALLGARSISNDDTDPNSSGEQAIDRSYRDPEYLREQYVEQRRSANKVADDCGVTSSTIHRWLDRLDIERSPRYKDEAWLRTQYLYECRDQSDIAEECDVATTTICHWLARHEITEGESFETADCASCGQQFRYYPSVRDGQYCSNECANEPRKRQVKVVCPGCEETFERRASLDTEYCSMACWSEDTNTVSDWSKMYRGVWYRQRRRAMRRDNYECAECGISNEEHKRRFGRALEVHHKVPVRLFDAWDLPIEDAHTLRNLITYCRTHHPYAPGSTVPRSDK